MLRIRIYLPRCCDFVDFGICFSFFSSKLINFFLVEFEYCVSKHFQCINLVVAFAGSIKIGHPKLDKQVKMNFDSSLVLMADVPSRFFCVSCGNLVILDYALQTAAGDLMCGDCSYCSDGFSDQLTLSEFAKVFALPKK